MANKKTLSIEELKKILRCEIEDTPFGVVVRVGSGEMRVYPHKLKDFLYSLICPFDFKSESQFTIFGYLDKSLIYLCKRAELYLYGLPDSLILMDRPLGEGKIVCREYDTVDIEKFVINALKGLDIYFDETSNQYRKKGVKSYDFNYHRGKNSK